MRPHSRRAWCRAALLAGACCLAPAAYAQSVAGGTSGGADGGASEGSGDSAPPALLAPGNTLLPAMGSSANDPDVRTHLLDIFGQSPVAAPNAANSGPAWRITPLVTVSEEFTTNANGIGGVGIGNGNHTSSDAITLIQPQVTIVDSSQRLQVNLNYAPTGEIFAVNSQDSQFRQQFNGNVLASAVPGLVFVDLRGAVFQQPVYAGLGQVNDVALGPNARETVSNVAATPYLVRNFGGLGTLQAGIGYIYSATDAPSTPSLVPQDNTGLPYGYGSSWLATRRLFSSFGTGEDLGRMQNVLGTDDNFYQGSGALKNGQRVLVTDEGSYAINRFAAALGEIGYENINYPNAGYGFVGGIWAVAGAHYAERRQHHYAAIRHIDGFSARTAMAAGKFGRGCGYTAAIPKV